MLVSSSAAITRTLRARSSGMEIVTFFTIQGYENTESVSSALQDLSVAKSAGVG